VSKYYLVYRRITGAHALCHVLAGAMVARQRFTEAWM
jgi:hypothetical protein